MENESKPWLMPACLGIGLAAFGIAYVVMHDSKQEAPLGGIQPVVVAAANEEPPPAKQEADPPKPPILKPAAAPRTLVLRQMVVPTDVIPDRFGHTPFDVKELVINRDGTRLVSRSSKEVISWNAATGRQLQTFLPPKLPWEYMTASTKSIYVSPDAKLIVTHSRTKSEEQEIELREAENGRVIGTAKLDKNFLPYDAIKAVSFSPGGEYVLVQGGPYGNHFMYAISTKSAARNIVNIPGKFAAQTRFVQTLPVPGEPSLIVERSGAGKNKSCLASLDLRTGTETPLAGFTVDPWNLFHERGVDLSADADLVLAAEIKKIQICERAGGRKIFERAEDRIHYSHPRFTPDGQRFLVVRHAEYHLIHVFGPKAGVTESVPDWIELYDIPSQKKIAQFTVDKKSSLERVEALALSQNGRVLAIAGQTKIWLLDFEAAFNVPPLAPREPPSRTDKLPLK